MAENRYIFEDRQTEENTKKINSTIPSTITSGTGKKKATPKTTEKKQSFATGFNTKFQNEVIQNAILSPLNQATGGLASPIYSSVRQLARGGSFKALAGGLIGFAIVKGIELGLEALNKKVAELDTQVKELGNNDNVLLRAGAINTATYYTRSFLSIKNKTNRS